MKPSQHVALGLGMALLLGTFATYAQVSPSSSAARTVPLDTLIATVAKNTGRKFVLDPRVRAEVALVGADPSSVTYDQLLAILDTYGFAAIDTSGYVEVVPLPEVREAPLPLVSDHETRPDNQYVTAVIRVRSLPTAYLVPILRPMVPQWGHLVAMPCDNTLIIVDRFANVRLMESIVKAMDTGAPITLPKCASMSQ
jgi:general secretion pathway protein D